MTYESRIDHTFDSGHADCKSQQVTLTMCVPCAEFLTRALQTGARMVEADPHLHYYMRAFEADLITQILRQTEDLDAELRGAVQ